MAPRKGIVKSGNAGNSSKTEKLSAPAPEAEKPLFPPGSKYPLSLLHERCQKLGWEKPFVDTHKLPAGWSFVVTLNKINKKTNQKESIRLEPNRPHLSPTSLAARHWGATYALYRFCNHMQLSIVLPPGPRDYWNELAVEHKNSPPHMKWMYESDPFTAQASKITKENEIMVAPASSSRKPTEEQVPGEFSQVPEVKMASTLRESVEDAIKKAISLYPEASEATSFVLSETSASKVSQQLKHLGFTKSQIRTSIDFLSQPSSFASRLLGSFSELDACIEYLVLHTPECDLPQSFLPSMNSSNPLITSAHSGTDDLKRRWIEDKAVKEGGWPVHVVRAYTTNPELLQNWDHLVFALGQKLIGEEWVKESTSLVNDPPCYELDAVEIEALGALVSDPTELVMPLFSAPIQIHILTSSAKGYPRPGYTPMYMTSTSIPPYVRLYLLSQILIALKSNEFIEPGESFCMAVMRFLEGEWAKIEDNGPPNMSSVLKHFTSHPQVPPSQDIPETLANNHSERRRAPSHRDARSDQQIKQEFETLRHNDEYLEILGMRQKLPAFVAKNDFLRMLENNRVVVVVGETGCGKTTQLPQFILDSLITSDRGSEASILVTQPRRISAISIAARVAMERLEDGSVGYAIRGESKQEKRTKLLFCTTGVVLRRLGSGDLLDGISHVVIDEVHERSIDGDFLLLELKELLITHPTLKVVLMSATINHEIFIKYFNGAPLLTIPGHTHPVTDRYLEDIIPLIHYQPPMPSGKSQSKEWHTSLNEYKSLGLDESAITTIKNITHSDQIDFQLIAAVVQHIVLGAEKHGGILIFLPGLQEIRQCIDTMRPLLTGKDVNILPLHANLSNDEQRRVFQKTSCWKIIATTNVAETSITIDDIIYVIDTGKVKETRYDPDTGLSRLIETWVTHATARQRKGRAGRTQPGVCYKLYTKKQESSMAHFPMPEILRVPLENVVLTVKMMREEEDVKTFLGKAIDPPKVASMNRALSTLKEIGAMDDADRLTSLGRHISMLPVDPRLAKMLVLGTIFQCLSPVLTITATLSSKPLFLSPMDKRDEAAQARARFIMGGSDLLTDMNAYDEYARLRSMGRNQREIRTFCEQNFLSMTTMRDVTTLRNDFILFLADLGFIPLSSTPSTPALNRNSNNVNLLKAIVLGGLWPNVARVHLPRSLVKFDKVQAGSIQRNNTAREYKIYDLKEGRVFLHPASVLFGEATWKSPFLVYFHKYMSTKVFLRDATEVPLYALLLFGGTVSINHIKGGLNIGSKENWIKLRAWPRIGVLVNQLRRLLDAQLDRCIEHGILLTPSSGNPVLNAMLALLTHDGLTE